MKTIQYILLLPALMGSYAMQAQNDETRTPGEFTGIRAGGAMTIQLSQDMTCSVKLSAEDAEDLAHIKTTVENGILTIARDGRVKKDVTIKVNMPNLRSVDLSGASEVGTLNDMASDTLDVTLSGGSEARLDLQAGGINAKVAGASELLLRGKGRFLNATLAGASEVKGYEFETESAKITAAGASEAHVNTKNLDAQAAGASEIHYVGSPNITRAETAGSSEIRPREGEHSSHEKNDTNRVHVAGKDYTIINDGNDHDSDGDGHHHGGGNYKFWQGIEFNVNGYLNSNNTTELPNGYNFLELNYGKSIGFSWNIAQKNMPIWGHRVQLFTGIGLDWNSYAFRNDITLRTDTSYVAATMDSIHYRADKLKTTFVRVPLMLEFNTNNEDEDKSFHLAGGMTFGYNIFDNRLKQKFEDDGSRRKRVIKDDYLINPVRMNLSARVGYGNFNMHADYSLTSLFEKNKGPNLYPFSAGVGFSF